MWDPKISEIGYGIHLLVILNGISIHFRLVSFKTYFSDEKTKQMKIARQSIAKEEDRLDN